MTLLLNPLCNATIGFRNTIFKATRSRYVWFSVKDQPAMSNLLLEVSKAKLTPTVVNQWPEPLFRQLVDYGLFVLIDRPSFSKKIKNIFQNPLNENRGTVLIYKGVKYRVTSFIFMQFSAKKADHFIAETAILPYWRQKFSNAAIHLITQGVTLSYLQQLSSRILKLLIKHGVLMDEKNCPAIDSFFTREGFVSDIHVNHLPKVEQANDMILNKNIYFMGDDEIPQELTSKIFNPVWVKSVKPSVWIEDPVTQVLFMYWLQEEHQTKLKQIISGELLSDKLDDESLKLFTSIFAIESAKQQETRKQDWLERVNSARQEIAERECLTLNNIIHPIQLTMLRNYLRYLYDQKLLVLDNDYGSTKKRYWQHQDNVTFYVQSQICTILNQILPSAVKIGHNAIAVYQPGAMLPKHRDEVLAFSWVMSLAIDTDPAKTREDAWPIYVKVGDKEEKTFLGAGDGHLINPQMLHWRDKLEDHSLGIMFLWFIPAEYRGYINGRWIGENEP